MVFMFIELTFYFQSFFPSNKYFAKQIDGILHYEKKKLCVFYIIFYLLQGKIWNNYTSSERFSGHLNQNHEVS